MNQDWPKYKAIKTDAVTNSWQIYQFKEIDNEQVTYERWPIDKKSFVWFKSKKDAEEKIKELNAPTS